MNLSFWYRDIEILTKSHDEVKKKPWSYRSIWTWSRFSRQFSHSFLCWNFWEYSAFHQFRLRRTVYEWFYLLCSGIFDKSFRLDSFWIRRFNVTCFWIPICQRPTTNKKKQSAKGKSGCLQHDQPLVLDSCTRSYTSIFEEIDGAEWCTVEQIRGQTLMPPQWMLAYVGLNYRSWAV